MGYGGRKEIKGIVRKGLVTVDNQVVKDSGMSVDPEKSEIYIGDEKVIYKNIYTC